MQYNENTVQQRDNTGGKLYAGINYFTLRVSHKNKYECSWTGIKYVETSYAS